MGFSMQRRKNTREGKFKEFFAKTSIIQKLQTSRSLNIKGAQV
jgi:hypothetical protein